MKESSESRPVGRPAWILRAVGRGWRKRCPHCGRGALFSRWSHQLARCAECSLVFERNPGDTWAFTVIGDRLPLAVMIMLMYGGVHRAPPLVAPVLFAMLVIALVWTTPNRWGVGLALHYVVRVTAGDADDPVPGRSTATP